MKELKKRNGEFIFFLLLFGVIITGLIYQYRSGTCGNDFWWHVKAGEWFFNNKTLPNADIFSWYARDNGIAWMPQEWLSEVVLYIIHHISGNVGIFLFSLFAAISMITLILIRNRQGIQKNILLSLLMLTPAIILFPSFFYGRPHSISIFFLFATLSCLYRYKNNEHSKAIYFIPVISVLWSNFHAGTAPLLYVLCFIFALTGAHEFSIGKLQCEKLSRRQLLTYLIIGGLSILAILANPSGYKALIYPFINIGDSYMQTHISEWVSPNVKNWDQLFSLFLPLIVVSISIVISEKKIKLLDFGLFLFFAYLFFRSVRFSILFFVAATFFAFDYFIPLSIAPLTKRTNYIKYIIVFIMLVGINIYSVASIFETARNETLISVVLDSEFVSLIKKERPLKLFNAYNYGETLIYNDIDTFVDAREDLFAKYNLKDAFSLLCLRNTTNNDVFDPQKLIDNYKFDGFIVESNCALASYLKSKPEKYLLLLEKNGAAYFKVIA
jgi:hypothetical protein